MVVLVLVLVFAQTTGDIVGTIVDDSGGALPGVTVEARSPSFQGVRTAVTDANGAYRLVLLPPGTYRVTAILQGFARAEQHGHRRAREDRDGRLPHGRRGDQRRSSSPARRRSIEAHVHDHRRQHRQPADQLPSDRPQLHLDRPDLGGRLAADHQHCELRQHDGRSTGPPGSRTASSSTASSPTASSTARRARSSTTSSSRSSRSRPAATRPSTGARRAGSSTSSRSRAATSSTATPSSTTTPTRSRPRTSIRKTRTSIRSRRATRVSTTASTSAATS